MRKNGLRLFDGCVRGVLAHAFDAVQAAGLGFVTLGDGDDLTVAGLEAEAELAGPVGVEFELGVFPDGTILLGLIFQNGFGRVLHHAGDAVPAGRLGGVHLGRGDHLAVARLQIELQARRDAFHHKFRHFRLLL